MKFVLLNELTKFIENIFHYKSSLILHIYENALEIKIGLKWICDEKKVKFER